MKNLLLTVFILICCAWVVNAETNKSIVIVQKSLARGEVKNMSRIFDQTIDITFSDDKATTYSKAQATAILKHFFIKSNTQDFKLLYQGKASTNNTLYSIGKLYTATATYSVYTFFVPSKNGYLLKELRFEKL